MPIQRDDKPSVSSREELPVEVSPSRKPELTGDKLFNVALAKAPSLTKEFVAKHNLDDEYLAAIARGEEPPPPVPGVESDLYLTSGGWLSVPKGVKPEDAGKNAVSR